MGRTKFKAAWAPCFFVLLLLAACSEEPDGPNRAHREDSPEGQLPQTTAPRASPEETSAGYVEHTVGDTVLSKDERVVSIEEAQLQRAEDGDEIAVLATIRGGGEYGRDCFLLEERAWLAMQRSFESGVWQEDALRNVEAWEDAPRSPDVTSGGGTYAKFFYEDPREETPDPRETPYFVLCYREDVEPDGGGGSMVWYDATHVEGTPGLS